MRTERRILTVDGSISCLVMTSGLPVRFDPPVTWVSFVGSSLALAIMNADRGTKNLIILGPSGDEIARLRTTCGTGVIDQVLDIDGELRVVEATPRGDFQARLDLDALTLERVGEWR